MNRRTRFFAGVLVVGVLVALTAFAGAVPADLELKKLTDGAPGADGQPPPDLIFRYCQPQTIVAQIGRTESPETSRLMSAFARPMPGDAEKPAFDEVVTKDRDYVADEPFRGVLALGDGFYGFAFDAVIEDDADEDADASAIPALNRLYIDLDHDGDLTDEDAVEATAVQTPNASYTICAFDPIDITIEAGGTTFDFTIRPNVYAQAQPGFTLAYARFSSCSYRDGEVELDGTSHRVVLVDYNSNGRFNDSAAIVPGSRSITRGDVLFVNPATGARRTEIAQGSFINQRLQVGPIIDLGGNLLDLTVSAAGDTCEIVPSKRAIGYITSTVEKFQAVVYGDLGVLTVSSDDSGRVSLPEGEWNVLSYSLDATGWEGESDTPAQRTMASASSPTDADPINVVADEASKMNLGAPFKTVVDVQAASGASTVSLGLSIIGVGGELCTSLYVSGARPPAPQFTITTEDGEVVDTGDFEYG